MKLSVIGIGRVGLPLALVLADEGFTVYGIDIDEEKKRQISLGKMPFYEESTQELLNKHINRNFLIGGRGDIKNSDVVILTVGTLLSEDQTPDMSAVYEALDTIVPLLKEKALVILRSTVIPHGTRGVRDYIDSLTKKKIYLSYAPERLAEGFAVKELYSLPQIVGTFDEESKVLTENVFKAFVPEIINTDPLTAELAKLTLNTYRYATFAVANELMMLSDYHGRDIYKVLEVANHNYIRGGIPTPGFAAGPCLVKDSFFIRHGTPYNDMITGSFRINDIVPQYLVDQIGKKVKIKGSNIAFLGLTFKKNVDDTRASLSTKMKDLLEKEGAKLKIHDPFMKAGDYKKIIKGSDALIISVNHDEYKTLSIKELSKLLRPQTVICDIWNVLGKQKTVFAL